LDKNTIDDGFLSFIAVRFGVSSSESRTKLKETINEWIKLLKAGKEVELEQLGFIKVNASKAVVFVETSRVSIDKKHFGLQAFKGMAVR